MNGKQKTYTVRLIDGLPADEYLRRNADPITLLQMGEYALLEERFYPPPAPSPSETSRSKLNPPTKRNDLGKDEDLPF